MSGFFGELLEYGSDLTTWTTAIGVEIGNDGETGFFGVFFNEAVEFVGRADLSYEGTGDCGSEGGGEEEESVEDPNAAAHCL